ncbi:unnamed protein product [Urochloa humidicola]
MEIEEEKLRLALLAAAPGGHQDISVTAVRHAIQEIPENHDTNLVVRRLVPGSFLMVVTAAVVVPDGSTPPAPSPDWSMVTGRAPALVVTSEGDAGLTGSSVSAAKPDGANSMMLSGSPEAEAENTGGALEASFSELVAFEV